MSKVKKIITGGLEFIKDSTHQLAKTVSPDELVKQALGRQKSEFSDYLKNLSPNLPAEELEKKKKKLSMEDQKELEETRKVLKAALPAHMRLPEKPKQPRAYEATIQEEERKKAQAVEAQKKTPQPVMTPAGKQPRGMLFGKKKVKGFEGLQKDTKVG